MKTIPELLRELSSIPKVKITWLVQKVCEEYEKKFGNEKWYKSLDYDNIRDSFYKWRKDISVDKVNSYIGIYEVLKDLSGKLQDKAVKPYANQKSESFPIFEEEDIKAEYGKPGNGLKATLLKGKPNDDPLTPDSQSGDLIKITEDEQYLIVKPVDAFFDLSPNELKEVDGYIEVTDNNMAPTFAVGDKIAISKLADWVFHLGKYYLLIDINGDRVIRKLAPGDKEDFIKLFTDSIEQAPDVVNMDKIVAIFKIVSRRRVEKF